MSVRSLTSLACALTTVLAVVLAPSSANADTINVRDPMSDELAGKTFMAAVCDLNTAADRMKDSVYGPDNWISLAEVRRRFPQVKRSTRSYARAHYTMARSLLHTPGDWPLSVANPVDQTAGKLLRMYGLLRNAAVATSPSRWIALTNRAHKITLPTATVRARLDLPPPGEGC